LVPLLQLVTASKILHCVTVLFCFAPAFQAEGASTEQVLSSALTSIMDALKSSDWNTRKAASLALSSIAVSSGYLVASFRTSCLRSLERSKFDKVPYPFSPLYLRKLSCNIFF
jgi:hypothetical protein